VFNLRKGDPPRLNMQWMISALRQQAPIVWGRYWCHRNTNASVQLLIHT
jgi:hypothetical protein